MIPPLPKKPPRKTTFVEVRETLVRLLKSGNFMRADFLLAAHGLSWDDIVIKQKPEKFK